MSRQETPPSTTERPNIQAAIASTVGMLLPHAAYNVDVPFETPIRWLEGYMEGKYRPFKMALWLTLTPDRSRTVQINRRLVLDPVVQYVWGVHINEPLVDDERGADQVSTSVGIRANSSLKISRTTSLLIPPDKSRSIGGEWEFNMSDERQNEVLTHITDVLAEAATTLPNTQRAFMEHHNALGHIGSFKSISHSTSREAVATLIG